MATPSPDPTLTTGRQTVTHHEGKEMHPAMAQHLAQIRIADLMQEAERSRRLRTAGSSRPRTIDAAPIKARFRRSILRLGGVLRGAPATG